MKRFFILAFAAVVLISCAGDGSGSQQNNISALASGAEKLIFELAADKDRNEIRLTVSNRSSVSGYVYFWSEFFEEAGTPELFSSKASQFDKALGGNDFVRDKVVWTYVYPSYAHAVGNATEIAPGKKIEQTWTLPSSGSRICNNQNDGDIQFAMRFFISDNGKPLSSENKASGTVFVKSNFVDICSQ